MGLLWSSTKEVFGATSHYESYAYTVVADHAGWQHRRYPKAIAAMTDCNDDDKGFIRLARYIGVFSTPENTRRDAVAMTTPVVNTVASSEPIAMTTPVVTGSGSRGTMCFVLPSIYQNVEDAPSPTDSSIRIVEVPEKEVAALQFSGWCAGTSAALAKYEELTELIKRHGLKPVGPWELHRFNPPYTLGPLRTNEVVVPVATDNATSMIANASQVMGA